MHRNNNNLVSTHVENKFNKERHTLYGNVKQFHFFEKNE